MPGIRQFALNVRRDWRANPRDPKARVILLMFRVAQLAIDDRGRYRVPLLPLVAVYRFLTEWLLGMELRPKTRVGPGLSLHHGFGLVVNDHAVIGEGVTLRHGVTIGHARPGGGCPAIGDGVQVGAGAIILGPINVGSGAIIAAGAVVTRDVPPSSIVRGNPAAVLVEPS